MEKKIQRNLLMMIFIVTVTVLGVSCNEDDEKPKNASCASLHEQLEAKYAETDEIGYNCGKMRELFADIVDILNEGKDCEEFKSIAADEGYESVEEYIDYLEQAFDAYMSDCPG